jgi:hypothetical protein
MFAMKPARFLRLPRGSGEIWVKEKEHGKDSWKKPDGAP